MTNLIKKLGRGVIRTISPFIIGLMLYGCPSPIPEPPESENKAPDTKITTEFQDDGTVKYTFSGIDPDGSIDYISTKINGGFYGDVPNNSSIFVPIIEGNNTADAIAYDNEGASDKSPATDSFISPTEEEASNLIESTLNPSTYNLLEKNILISVGEEDSFYGNTRIKKLNNTDAIIDYMGTNGNLLTDYGIPNICPKRTSIEELERKVLEFQNNGYN